MSKVFELLKTFFRKRKPPKIDPFLEMVETYRQRANSWPTWQNTTGPRIGVLLTPWLSTAVPLFALECVEMLYRAGRTPVALFDATPVIKNPVPQRQINAIERLLAECFPKLEVQKIEGAGTVANERDRALAKSLFRENAIWQSRGEVLAEKFMEDNAGCQESITNHLGRVRAFLSSAKLDHVLIPGGVFGLSGLYAEMARELQLPFATFDGGLGLLRITQGGVAAHLADVPVVFNELIHTLAPEQRTQLIRMGEAELDDRRHARDFRQFQVSAATGRDDLHYDLFVPLNVRWDTAALNRQRAFPTVANWLDELLSWVEARPGITICLRQHPRERVSFVKGSDDLRPLLDRHAKLGSRLRFVSAEEELSSYDLMRNSRAVLPHTSTVGIEAAMLGLPVILGTSVYYEDFGFCHKAATPAEYFASIEEALAGRTNQSDSQRSAAALAYYITQRCAILRTDFTGHPVDYQKWIQIPHEDLWEQPEQADFRTSLLSGDPMPLVRHRRLSSGN